MQKKKSCFLFSELRINKTEAVCDTFKLTTFKLAEIYLY